MERKLDKTLDSMEMYKRWSDSEGNKNYKSRVSFGRDTNRVD